jgi:hydroxyproline O-arabinosyltransferase
LTVASLLPPGNAPTLMAFDDLGKVAPLWMNLSLAIFLDKEANKEWGWVQVGSSSICSSIRVY